MEARMSQIVKQELIEFIKKIKNQSEEGMDKHLCDHLIWLIEEKRINWRK